MANHIELKSITQENLKPLWDISFGPKADLEWMKWNGPYFNDPVQTFEEFSTGWGKSLVKSPMAMMIMVNDKIVGLVMSYWADNHLKQWLEVGISIYDSTMWGKGIGSQALLSWLQNQFDYFDYLPHIGFTTWSGNEGMQRLGEKCGMTKEAVIRKVRYLNGQYYDSVKYGVLREEFNNC